MQKKATEHEQTERWLTGSQVAVIFGRRCRLRRKELKLSLVELGRRCGISQPYLSEVETGKRNISLHLSVRIAKVLGCSVYDLLEGVGVERTGDTG